MKHLHSYSTVYALGHRAIADILKTPVVVEEKVDGSQFSMSRISGELACRSKGQDLIVDAPEKMFHKAVETAKSLSLVDGWVYRCEYLQSPKHNTLAYARHPKQHIILLDVETAPQNFLAPAEKAAEAARLGLEVVPCVFDGMVADLESLKAMIERESILGGVKVEGVVVKNYGLFTEDKKFACAKLVCEGFKEKNAANWKEMNPTKADVVVRIITALKTEARWHKAIQHLRDAGILTESPRDIGNLIKEIQADILKEEKEWIMEQLFSSAAHHILRGVVAGVPEWYKEELAKKAFETSI